MTVRQWSIGLRLGALLGLVVHLGALASAAANDEASEARLKRDITFLASDECEGRGPGTKGIDKAADYIAAEFKKAGLKPGGVAGGYFQPFPHFGAGKLRSRGSLTLHGPQGQVIPLEAGVDFEVTGGSGPGKLEAPLVFAGFGAIAPEEKYDDYKDLDVAGKVVVVIRRVPRWDNKHVPLGGTEEAKTALAELLRKFANAEAHRAAAVLLVNDASELAGGDKLKKFETLKETGVSIPVLHVRRSLLDPILRSSLGEGLKDLEHAISGDLRPRGAPLRGWTARLEAPVDRTTFSLKNVIGVLEGSGPLANETVVVGAHYDHLGYGGTRSSLAKDRTKKQIHPGADDNGSGTTAVLELARRFAEIPNRKGRRLVFMTFSGEELGLLGSAHYCNKEPLFPLKDTVAMVNLDMVGRLSDKAKKLLVEGVQAGKGFDELIERFNKKHGFQLTKHPGSSPYSDHASFYRKRIPVLFLWTGTHSDYHRPGDTADKINVPGMRRITDLAEDLVAYFATVAERPQYTAIKGGGTTGPPRGKGPTLGIAPGDYDAGPDAPKGLLVGQVIEGRPADKAGMKAGDLIVEIAGKQITNIATYMAVMGAQNAGSEIEVGVLRNGKKLTLKVTPQ
ncbi:MAG TPA: M28 family peptidase [Gemmataceae bacterium]|nr:M28 family peptidase [Gemmataceae bacterium]